MMLLELDESGSIRFLHDEIGALAQFNQISYQQLFFDRAADLVFQTIMFMKIVSDESGYGSAWDIAVGMEKLAGTRPRRKNEPTDTFGTSFGAGYEAGLYQRSARANTLELQRAPGRVVDRLLGAYARSAEIEGQLRPMFDLKG